MTMSFIPGQPVPYPPLEPGQYSFIETYAWGMIPVRVVVSKRVDGWCAYLLLKRMPAEYAELYGDPVPFEAVRDYGDKVPGAVACEQFPEMGDDYAY